MPVTIRCLECGRTAALPAAAVARRKRCAYCGGEIRMDGDAEAAVEDAEKETVSAEDARAKISVDCPVCGRTLRLPGAAVGTDRICQYCSCPFFLRDPDDILPGPASTQMVEELPENADELAEQAAAALGYEHLGGHGWTSLPKPVTTSLDALRRRILRGAADLDEARETARLIDRVMRAEPFADMTWICPLPPAMAADLLTRVVLFKEQVTADARADGTVVVRVTTGSHTKGTGGGGSGGTFLKIIGAVALALTTGVVIGGRRNDDTQSSYEVRHFLCIRIDPAEEGCVFSLSHEWAGGEEKPLTAEQEELAWNALRALDAVAWRAACFRAVFGEWFNGNTLMCLREEQLRRRLRRLSPGLEDAAADLLPD